MTIHAPESGDDPYARTAQVFPILSAEMLERVTCYGTVETMPAQAALYCRGDKRIDFFVVLEGEVGIFRTEQGEGGTESLITTHCHGQFTGELDHVSARASLVTARAITLVRAIRVPAASFRRMLSAEPDLAELVMGAFILRRMGFLHHGEAGITLIGPAASSDVLRLERFAIRNGYPLQLLDAGTDAGARSLNAFGLTAADLPAVLTPSRGILRNPSIAELADQLGLTEPFLADETWDVAVVGAGPSGLSAATYAASEGLKTVVIEGLAPGGQAGTSSHIENYLGFPTGISGQALAGRAQVQAQKFGARIAVSRMATALDCLRTPFRIEMEDGQTVLARSIVIASGAHYRRLSAPGYTQFEGAGIHYAATAMEASVCAGQTVVVVGGGNSAGQAAVFLSRQVEHVHMLVRKEGLASTMSDYLVQRIDRSPRITLHPFSEVSGLCGDQVLREVAWRDVKSGVVTRVDCGALFVMIGAEPNTAWLKGCLPLDGRGFVSTGHDGSGRPLGSPYATTHPGIYAVGDVRSGSVKRVASGVGEGSVVIQDVHSFLEAQSREMAAL